MEGEQAEIPIVIGGKRIHTGDLGTSIMPCDHQHVIAKYHKATPAHVEAAIAAAAAAHLEWSSWRWEDRAAVFLRAAELLTTTWSDTVNASTMLGQAKTAYQTEIDARCELIDFWRFNAQFAQELYSEQPISDHASWNQLEYRPLEGFVYAVSPFNFTAIGGNLAGAPALMGNTVLWKPAATAMLSAWNVFQLLEEAGLPPGVINFLPGDPVAISNVALKHRDLAGVHFTGSTGVFNHMWETIGKNMGGYKSYPRIVGETGGKDFIVAHASADAQAVAVGMVRGAFEYQGQKCSAASRAYIPKSMWPDVRDRCVAMMARSSRAMCGISATSSLRLLMNARSIATRVISILRRAQRTSSRVVAPTRAKVGSFNRRWSKRRIRRAVCCAKKFSGRFCRCTCTMTRSGKTRCVSSMQRHRTR